MPREASELMENNEDLLSICLNLHMAETGASDPLPPEVHERYLRVLTLARNQWKEGHATAARFDNAVFELVSATLSEAGRV